MTDQTRKDCFGILADSVSEVVGNRSLVYIAVKQAALTGDISKERWADTLFSQVSAKSRREIRSAALQKAAAEQQQLRKQLPMSAKEEGEVVVADLQKLFGGARPVF
jgi:DNA helicase TIP49 (TBP-interacting protein)